MRRALTDTAWDSTLSGDPQQEVTTITTILHILQQQHVPHRAYTTSPKDQPWFGFQCRVAAERKYNAWRRYKRRPNLQNKALHRAVCKAMTRTAKWEENTRLLSSNQLNPKQQWSLVKERQGERIQALNKLDGSLAVTNQEKADLLAQKFSAKMRTPKPDRSLPALPRLGDSCLDIIIITEEAVKKHLKGANTKKAPDSDDLSPHLLKHCADDPSGSLALVFRQCLQSRMWPSQWKETKLTLVHKKLRSEPNN